MSEQRYVVVIEGAPGTNYRAYVPDVPGCTATGDTVEACEASIWEATTFHLGEMGAVGEPIPELSSVVAATVVEVPAA